MQRCHRASGRYSEALSIKPRQASEMMSCTPARPRSTRWRRNADQPDLSSLAPSQMPRISRKPSELTALATSRETLRTSPAQVRGSVQILSHIGSGDGSGLRDLRLIERPHVHVAFAGPSCASDVAQPCCSQVETGLAIREGSYDAGSASDLSHDPL